MTTVFEDFDLPTGGTPWPASVRIQLAGAQGRPVLGRVISTGKVIAGETVFSTGAGIDTSGFWSADLPANADIMPSGTTWRVTRKVGCELLETYISVPVTGGPYEAYLLEDDPLNEITPSALGVHAADLALHGGGIDLDYKYLDTTVTVTGTGGGLTLAPLTALTVTVPDVARPIWLLASVPVIQTPGGPAEQSWGWFVNGSYGAFGGHGADSPPDIDTTNIRRAFLAWRLPPLSGGLYTPAGTGTSGNLTARTPASSIGNAWARAVAA